MQSISLSYGAFVTRVQAVERGPVALAYWQTDAAVASLATRFRCRTSEIRAQAGSAMLRMPRCPVCGGPFMANSRERAIALLRLPIYGPESETGSVPVCCGAWVTWYHPLDPPGSFPGDGGARPYDTRWRGEYGGGKIGARWRELNNR